MTLSIVSPPGAKPVDAADLKAHLRVTSSAEGGVIDDCLDTAIAMLDGEGELGAAMISQTWAETFPRVPGAGGDLDLSLGPISEILAVDYRDQEGAWQAAPLADFELYDGGGRPFVRSDAWPAIGAYPDAIKITFIAGFGPLASDVPAPLRQAVKLLAANFYEIREPVVLGVTPAEMPISVDRLIAPYRRWLR